MSGRSPVELAGFAPRLAAQLIDILWMLPVGVALESLGRFARGGAELSPGAEILLQLIAGLMVVLFWASRQATPGKMAMRLRVVDAVTGTTPAWTALVARYLGYAVAALPLCLGFLAILWDPRRQGWHDRLAGTVVVQDPLPPR